MTFFLYCAQTMSLSRPEIDNRCGTCTRGCPKKNILCESKVKIKKK